MRSSGWGPWRCDWYSICSHHRDHDPECKRCLTGRWVSHWAHAVGHLVYLSVPGVWRWWVNRPDSKSRRFLEQTFPGLRGRRS